MISSVVFPQTNAINPFSSAIENRIHAKKIFIKTRGIFIYGTFLNLFD